MTLCDEHLSLYMLWCVKSWVYGPVSRVHPAMVKGSLWAICGRVFGFAWGDLVVLRTWTFGIFSVWICVCKRMRAACDQLIEIVLLCFA